MVKFLREGVLRMTEVYLALGDDGKAASRRAMAAALARRDIPADAALAKTALGKPYLPDWPAVQLSLSHSGGYGVCAVSDAPVGVDVELIRPLRRDVPGRFFTPAEQAWLTGRPESAFFRLWTRKESFVKALGRGLTLPLNRFSVLDAVLLWEGDAW